MCLGCFVENGFSPTLDRLDSHIYLQANKGVLTNNESAGCHVHCYFFTYLVLFFSSVS